MYTVLSRGRPLGVTDLDFIRLPGRNRSGRFHPNAEGERLMPVIASTIPAMRAYMHRDVTKEEGGPIVQPHLIGSALFAGLAEALHHVGSLDLALHREDGSIVPTELVGFQDTEQLLDLSNWDDVRPPGEAEALDEARDEALDEAVDYDLRASRELWSDADDPFAAAEWVEIESWSGEGEAEFPRYQIHVTLAEGVELP